MNIATKIVSIVIMLSFILACSTAKQHFNIEPTETSSSVIQHAGGKEILVSNKDHFNVAVLPLVSFISNKEYKRMIFEIMVFNNTDDTVNMSHRNIKVVNAGNTLHVLSKDEAKHYARGLSKPDYRGMSVEQMMEFSKQRSSSDTERIKLTSQLISLIDEKYIGFDNIYSKESYGGIVFVALPIYGDILDFQISLRDEKHYFKYLVH